jgi:hypothetical protein
MIRANGSIELAPTSPGRAVLPDAYLEDFCFDAQLATEEDENRDIV